MNNDGVTSTAHAMLAVDDATELITSWELVFTKFIDKNGEVQTQNFDGQTCRATIARSCLEIKGRYRDYYADNGFRELKRYQHFMTAPGEDPTRIIFRRRGRARGGGGIEVSQQMIDSFLKLRPYYVRERDFRRSRRKSEKTLKTAADLRKDFAQYVWHWNNDKDPNGGPSRIERWNAGPNLMLTAPSPTNLAMFALTQWRDTREPRQDPESWFTLKGISYVGARPDSELYERFAALSIRRSKLEAKKRQEAEIKICVFEFGGTPPQRLVLFSLDDEETWEFAVPAESRELSRRRHNDMLIKVEDRLEHGDATDLNDFFAKIILTSADGPLIIDGLSRKRQFYHYQSAEAGDRSGIDTTSATEADSSVSGDNAAQKSASPESELQQVQSTVVAATEATEAAVQALEPDTPSTLQPEQAQPSASARVSQTRAGGRSKGKRGHGDLPDQAQAPQQANDDEDIPNFIAELQRKDTR